MRTSPCEREVRGGTQPGDAAADDEEIRRGAAPNVILPNAHAAHRASASRPPPRRAYSVLIGEARDRHPAAACSIAAALGPRRIVVSSPRVWDLHGPRFRKARRGSHADPGRPTASAYKKLHDRGARLRRARPGATPIASTVIDRRGRRRDRRHGRFRRGHLPARHRAGARADDAAGAGRQRHRRQGRRESPARQEPDRRVSPAAAWSSPIRLCSTRCRGASSAPGCTRSIKYGVIVEPVAVRPRSDHAAGDLRARTPRRSRRSSSRIVPDQGRGRVGRRARGRAAAHSELRPHRRPRARGGDEVPALSPRRGGRLRHAARRWRSAWRAASRRPRCSRTSRR